MRCELSFVLSRPRFKFATGFMIWCRQPGNGLRITTDKAHIATWCKTCMATASDLANINYRPTSEYGRYCSTTFWVRSGHRSTDATPICRWVSTKLSSLKYIEDYWKLSWLVAKSIHTNDTRHRGQDKTVYCPCRRCELGVKALLP